MGEGTDGGSTGCREEKMAGETESRSMRGQEYPGPG